MWCGIVGREHLTCTCRSGRSPIDDSTSGNSGGASSFSSDVKGIHRRTAKPSRVVVRATEVNNDDDESASANTDHQVGLKGTPGSDKLKTLAESDSAKTALLGILFAGWYLANIAFNLYNKQARGPAGRRGGEGRRDWPWPLFFRIFFFFFSFFLFSNKIVHHHRQRHHNTRANPKHDDAAEATKSPPPPRRTQTHTHAHTNTRAHTHAHTSAAVPFLLPTSWCSRRTRTP